MNCPKCKVQLSKREYAQGVCEICGWERKSEQRLAANRAANIFTANPVSAPVAKTTKVTIAKTVKVSLHSAGYIEGKGFSVAEADIDSYNAQVDRMVLRMSDGKTFIGQAVLSQVSSRFTGRETTGTVALRIGRATLWQVTESTINDILNRTEYPDRSSREAEVTRRNTEFALWLAEFAGIA